MTGTDCGSGNRPGDRCSRLACGVAGWSYDDWNDTVYRVPKEPPPQLELFSTAAEPQVCDLPGDRLAFLAGFVDMIEIDSSFYRIPTVRTTRSWARRVEWKPGFFFTAKLHRDFTHRFLHDTREANAYRNAFTPLCEHGVLNGLLAQFRYDMRDTPETRRHLQWLKQEFSGLAPLVVEVRHSSWQGPEAMRYLRELDVAVAVLDYPVARNAFTETRCIAGRHAYFRLHGRNRAAWFSKDVPVYETYNYDYSQNEIRQLANTAKTLIADAGQLTIVANNHYRGKAVSAALRLKAELLQQQIPVPPALLKTYPHLDSIASTKD